MVFERLAGQAVKAIMFAQEEARRLGHNFVGTEQILLGLIAEYDGIAAQSLRSMGIELEPARVEVEKIIGRGSEKVDREIPFTPRAKRMIELSMVVARELGHEGIGTEHLLLGLIREGGGVGVTVLENFGIEQEWRRQKNIEAADRWGRPENQDLNHSDQPPPIPILEAARVRIMDLLQNQNAK